MLGRFRAPLQQHSAVLELVNVIVQMGQSRPYDSHFYVIRISSPLEALNNVRVKMT